MKYCWSREVYRFSQQQFLNAIFAWNQDEVPQNSREAKKILQYKLSLALKQLRHFYGSGCSFAKIAIPYTIYLSLNLPEFYG